ncbi:hypothetical protein ABK040_007568 [Willaertia magna]
MSESSGFSSGNNNSSSNKNDKKKQKNNQQITELELIVNNKSQQQQGQSMDIPLQKITKPVPSLTLQFSSTNDIEIPSSTSSSLNNNNSSNSNRSSSGSGSTGTNTNSSLIFPINISPTSPTSPYFTPNNIFNNLSDYATKTLPPRLNRGENSSSYNTLLNYHFPKGSLFGGNNNYSSYNNNTSYNLNSNYSVPNLNQLNNCNNNSCNILNIPLNINNNNLDAELRRRSSFAPNRLKRAHSVLGSKLTHMSLVRHHLDPKWDLRNDDCFGDDIENEEDENNNSSPIAIKSSPRRGNNNNNGLIAAGASNSYQPTSNVGGYNNSPRLTVVNSSTVVNNNGGTTTGNAGNTTIGNTITSRDRAMSVDLSTLTMTDKMNDIIKERAITIHQKMIRDLKTFLWELKDIETKKTIELKQLEQLAKDILDCDSVDDLCKRDYMIELQTILNHCIENMRYQSQQLLPQNSSMSNHVENYITNATFSGSGSSFSEFLNMQNSEYFESLRQAKKFIFIFSRLNRVLEIYKRFYQKKNQESIKELIKQQRQRFKSIAVIDSPTKGIKGPFPTTPTNEVSNFGGGSKPSTPTVQPNNNIINIGQLSLPKLPGINSEDNEEYDNISSNSSKSNSSKKSNITGSPHISPRVSVDDNNSPIPEKKKSEGFFARFKTLFTSKREEDILLPMTSTKSRSATNTPKGSSKKEDIHSTLHHSNTQPILPTTPKTPIAENLSVVTTKSINPTPQPQQPIEILCRICEELVPRDKLAEHSATCAVKHKLEMQNVTVSEKIKNIRKAIEKTLRKHKSKTLHKLYKIAKRAEDLRDRNELQEMIGNLNQIIDSHKEDNYAGNNYRISVYAKRLHDVIESKCTTLLQEEKQQLINQQTQNSVKKPKISDFEIVKPISRGAYGRVYLVKKKSTKDIYAIKVIKKNYLYKHKNFKTLTNQQDLINERTIMKMLIESNEQSPFIVNFYYSFAGKKYLYIVMEYCPGGSLDCLLAEKLERGEAFDVDTVRHIAAETCLALSDLHHNKIVHRDLKPDNMLIDRNGHLKLTDFGLSEIGLMDREDEQTNTKSQVGLDEIEMQSVRGTPDYLAPELLLGIGHSEAVDYWALGCICFELLFGCPPFNDETPELIFDNILSHRVNWVDQSLLPDEIVSSGVLDFIDRLLDPNPQTRLNEKTLKQHPFMKNVNWDKVLKEPLGVLPNNPDLLDTSRFKMREENYPMLNKCDSTGGIATDNKSLSDIDDSSETASFSEIIPGSIDQTPPLLSSQSMRDMKSFLQSSSNLARSLRSNSFTSTTSGSDKTPTQNSLGSSLILPSDLIVSPPNEFDPIVNVNTHALTRLNEQALNEQLILKYSMGSPTANSLKTSSIHN